MSEISSPSDISAPQLSKFDGFLIKAMAGGARNPQAEMLLASGLISSLGAGALADNLVKYETFPGVREHHAIQNQIRPIVSDEKQLNQAISTLQKDGGNVQASGLPAKVTADEQRVTTLQHEFPTGYHPHLEGWAQNGAGIGGFALVAAVFYKGSQWRYHKIKQR